MDRSHQDSWGTLQIVSSKGYKAKGIQHSSLLLDEGQERAALGITRCLPLNVDEARQYLAADESSKEVSGKGKHRCNHDWGCGNNDTTIRRNSGGMGKLVCTKKGICPLASQE